MNQIEIENAFYKLMLDKEEHRREDIIRLRQIRFALYAMEDLEEVREIVMPAIDAALLACDPYCRVCGSPAVEVIVGWWDEQDTGSAWTVCPNHMPQLEEWA